MTCFTILTNAIAFNSKSPDKLISLTKNISGSIRKQRIIFSLLLLPLIFPLNADEINYRVKPGDSLWSISDKLLTQISYWRDLQKINQVKDPYRLKPDSIIRIPKHFLKTAPIDARLMNYRGNVEVYRVNGEPVDATRKMPLAPGDIIVTNSNANVSIEYLDGSSTTVYEQSEITIKKLESSDSHRDIRLHLKNGRADNRVKKKSISKSRFEISTPSAIAAVRGTLFRVISDPDTRQVRAEVLEGEVAISSEGKTVFVEEGFGTVVKKGEAPKIALKLLPKASLSNLPTHFVQKPQYFEIPLIENALSYHIEISRAADTTIPVMSVELPDPKLRNVSLENGEYILRTFAFDKNGLGGKTASHHFTVEVPKLDAPPLAPDLVNPPKNQIISLKTIDFRWNSDSGTGPFHFQLARDPAFSQILIDVFPYGFTELNIANRFGSGEYFWHVASINPIDNSRQFSTPDSFRIPPAIPQLKKTTINNKKIRFSWRRTNTGEKKYLVEIAEDENFVRSVITSRVNQSYVAIPFEIGIDYFFRVRSLDADGFASEFSNTQHVSVEKSGFFSWELKHHSSTSQFTKR